MMVTFVSQCEKKALMRTRKVLDAFADRIGSNTWQTVITQEGLQAIKKSLRKTASKNTAVSCHWIRSRSRSELVWVVGNRDKFNKQGVVPVNTTQRNILQSQIENDWHYLPLIKALVALSALLHDWGKASELFQKKLQPSKKRVLKGDPIRHEWISCLLLNALVKINQVGDNKTDRPWLEALINGAIDENSLKKLTEEQIKNPLSHLPSIAKLIAWLIVSHHRLPLLKGEKAKEMRAYSAPFIDDVLKQVTQQWGYENKYDEAEYHARVTQCFSFPHGLISHSKKWLAEIKKWSKRLLDCEPLVSQALEQKCYRSILCFSRLCLMLGDHYYSSQDAAKHWPDTTGLFANTDRKTHQLKQKLDEHLVGVAKQGLRTAHLLPAFEKELPFAQDTLALKKLSPPAYRWQDKAVDVIAEWKKNLKQKQGFFAVNMASTGCGKTFANAKVMRALSEDGNSLRFILALGLRTLTLQTGDEYRDRVGLDDSELAVLIGSRAVMELHQQRHMDEDSDSYENSGSLSEEKLLDEDIDYDCAIPEEGLATVLTTERDRKFLYAPVLACTIDHIMAATETKRGGRYILPTLRLMSSDLVIDEVDDFSGNDLIAIARLIHLAGMLGKKVMISSATIPPDLAEGYFKAYRDGWKLYCQSREADQSVACAWIDEFDTQLILDNQSELRPAIEDYEKAHKTFVEKRVRKLAKQTSKRKADIVSCEVLLPLNSKTPNDNDTVESKQNAYFHLMAEAAFRKHKQHFIVDTKTQLQLSFGLIRVANIAPCVALARYLLTMPCADDTDIRVLAYHSQQVLLLRHKQEQHLDKVLKRKEKAGEQATALSDPVIRQHLDTIAERSPAIKNVLFILVATPVEEVGRDHDFDWAVVEPSSFRSIIQLAGRVRRHRHDGVQTPNISLMQYNWKGIKQYHKEDSLVFCHPGFETGSDYRLKSHSLNDLVDPELLKQKVNAIPRIIRPEITKHKDKLADLEHHVMRTLLANYSKDQKGPANLQGYLREDWFLTALPQELVQFREGRSSLKIFLVFDEDSQGFMFCEKNDKGIPIHREGALGINRLELSEVEINRLWLKRDFATEVETLADLQESTLNTVSLRYGELSFLQYENTRYDYNDQLGLVKK